MNFWKSATVHGAIVVYPMPGISYPFPKPHADIPIILDEWWKKDLREVVLEYIASGSNIMHSDAFTINGTFKIAVETGKTYLLRIVNAAVGKTLVFEIAMHNLTVVAMDGRPVKNPFTSDYVELSVQQSFDCILETNQQPDHYYMAAREYVNGLIWQTVDNTTTTTAILEYRGNYVPSSPPFLPFLPNSNYDTSLIHDKISSTSKLYLAIIFLILGLASYASLAVWYRRHRCVVTAVVTPQAEI
uniref:Laccase-14-like n=1 Tax=Nicotiana tabacum TaxID=4097 RepID=A0A1S3ZIN3_TOBAC|nr:PREDICTED: laccase-14-like [Nicotiana tabacum]